MRQRRDITGQKFGKLTAIKYVGSDEHYKQKYECECECGNHVIVYMDSLLRGNTKSCGCIMASKKANKSPRINRTPNTVCPICGNNFMRLLDEKEILNTFFVVLLVEVNFMNYIQKNTLRLNTKR